MTSRDQAFGQGGVGVLGDQARDLGEIAGAGVAGEEDGVGRRGGRQRLGQRVGGQAAIGDAKGERQGAAAEPCGGAFVAEVEAPAADMADAVGRLADEEGAGAEAGQRAVAPPSAPSSAVTLSSTT
jgi:hypothetical protein